MGELRELLKHTTEYLHHKDNPITMMYLRDKIKQDIIFYVNDSEALEFYQDLLYRVEESIEENRHKTTKLTKEK